MSTLEERGIDLTELYYQCPKCTDSFATDQARQEHRKKEHSLTEPEPCPFDTLDGYEYWEHRYEGATDMVSVHQLLAIADGADPYEVFAEDTVVHHGPDIEHPRANLPGNVQVMDQAEHARYHNQINEYVLLGELYRLDRELDHTPQLKDMKEYGEYSLTAYYGHFDSWSHAKELAGVIPE